MTQWTTFHPSAFFLTFISYALYHIVRKTPSYVQTSLISEWTSASQQRLLGSPTFTRKSLFQDQQDAEAFMGILNAIFLFVYAVGNFLSGMLADRVDQRLFLTVGMILSSVVMFIFGPVLEWTASYSQAAYIALEVLNALLQSTGWPCLVPVMANWFNKRSRGYILGVWSSSPSAGSILGALMVSAVVGYGYEYAFVLTSSLLFAGGVLVYFGLITSPREVGLVVEDDDDDNHSDDNAVTENDNSKTKLLLGKRTSHHGNDVPHLLYGSYDHKCSGMTCSSGKVCSIKCRHGDRMDSATDCQCDTAPPLNKTTSASRTSRGQARTVAADSVTGTDGYGQGEHSFIDIEGNDVNDGCFEKQFSDTKHQNKSDCITSSQKPTLKDGCFENQVNKSIYVHNLLQRENLEDSGSDVKSPNSALGTPVRQNTPMEENSESGVHSGSKAISFLGAVLLPGVIPYSLCFAFLKLVVYVFFFWLPFYLASSYGWAESTADRLSLWYDVGGILGATISAFLMSRLNKSALIMIPMLAASIPMMYVYGALNVGRDMTVNVIMLFCLGFLLGGVANILSAAVSASFSRQESLRGNLKAMSTVTGILEGTGTVGAALGQLAVPYLNASFGWSSVFYFLMVSVFLSAVSISPLFVSEVKEVRRGRKKP